MDSSLATQTTISLIAELDGCRNIEQLAGIVPQYLDQLGVAFGGVCLLDDKAGDLSDSGLFTTSNRLDVDDLNNYLSALNVEFDPSGSVFKIMDRTWEKVYRQGLTLLAGNFNEGFDLPDVYHLPLEKVFREFCVDAGLGSLFDKVTPQNILDVIGVDQFLLCPFSSNEGISGALAIYGSKTRPVGIEHYTTILSFSRIVGLAYSRLLKERQLAIELENIKASEEKYRAILSMPDFLTLLIDHEGTVLEASDKAEKYLGQTAVPLIGENLFDLQVEKLPPWDREMFRQATDKREMLTYQTSLDNSHYENVIHPIQNKAGVITRFAVFLTDITERLNNFCLLQESEEKFRSLFESARDAIFIADANTGMIVDVNEAASELMGMEHEQLIGMHQREMHPPEEIERYEIIFKEHATQAIGMAEDIYIRRSNGTNIPIEIRASTFSVGDRNYVQGTFHDISQIKKARQQLEAAQVELEDRVIERTLELEQANINLRQENEERNIAESHLREERDFIAAVLDITASLVVVLDDEARIIRFNKACELITGYSFEEVKGTKIWSLLIAPEDRGMLEKIFGALIDGKFPKYAENDWLTKGGERKRIAWSNSILKDKHGDVKYVIANGIDLTELSRAEKALAESEKKFRAMIEQSADCIMLIDYHSGKILDVNNAVREMLGYTSDEIKLISLEEIVGDWDEKFVAKIDYAVKNKSSVLEEKKCTRKDGGKIEMEVKISPVTFSDKEVLSLFARDVTDRNKAEIAVRESEREYRTVIDAIDNIIHVVDRNLKVIITNSAAKAWYKKVGLDPNIEGQQLFDVFDFLPPMVAEEYQRVFDSGEILLTEEETVFENQRVVTETRKIPIIEDGIVNRIATVMSDITERKDSEDKLISAYEELRELDELKNNFISNISHELRTPLVAVKGYTELMLRKKVREDQYFSWLGIIHRSSVQLEEIINGLLDISRLHAGTMAFEYGDLHLSYLIESSLKVVALTLNEKDIEIAVDVESDLPRIVADTDKMLSVLVNLLGNAIKFSEPGTKITVRAELINDSRVRVSVSDQGIGISEKYLRKIFTRFFQVDSSSTRLYGGSGLGLALVKEIIQAHHGKVWAESELWEGTTIYFELPVVESAQKIPRVINLAEKRKTVADQAEDKYKVMVVDDDEEVIKLLTIVLARIDCEIIPVDNGHAALKLLMQKPVDLVLLDIGMTEMDGIELCTRIKKENVLKRIPVYMLSAYTSAKYHEAASDAGCNGFVNKPFSIQEITDLVNENRKLLYGKL
jgi:two-component system, sporulation sensor kinase E